MLAVVQRVNQANVTIENKIFSEIGHGLLILLGVGHEDTEEDVMWLSSKIANLRIFSDTEGKMNLSVKDIDGEVLVVSQFTLFASTKKGNRPSFTEAAKPELAIPMYEHFVAKMDLELNKKVQTGQFAADMKVTLLNDGPVTILIDTKNRK
jgi:D-aminoacyl-tRNA deacylase